MGLGKTLRFQFVGEISVEVIRPYMVEVRGNSTKLTFEPKWILQQTEIIDENQRLDWGFEPIFKPSV